MDNFWEILLIVAGLVLLIKGADWLVTGSATLGRHFKVSEIAMGLSVVALGTSAPEIVVNVISGWQGHSDLVFANVMGSNIFNLYVVMGFVGLIYPLQVRNQTVWKEIPFLLFISLLLFFLLNDQLFFERDKDTLSLWEGIVLLGLLVLFMIYVFAGKHEIGEVVLPKKDRTIVQGLLFVVLGIAALGIGGNLVVNQAVVLAKTYRVSEKMIALLVLAPGTSLPELATSLIAVIRKRYDLAVGNLIGSNVFNFLLVLGGTSLVGSSLVYDHTLNFDLYFFFFGVILLFISMFTSKAKRLDRIEAIVFLIFFLGYLYFIFIRK